MPLFLFVLIATISPGGATTLATASGANFGLRRSISLIVGISVGLGSMAALAAAGLAALIVSKPMLQTAMKLVGSVYLLWLAWQTSRRGRPNFAQNVGKPISVPGGVGLLWINPKGWAMTLSAAASFTAIADGPLRFAILLGVTFAVLSSLSLVVWCFAGLMLARVLQTDAQWRALNITLGVLLAASILPIWLE